MSLGAPACPPARSGPPAALTRTAHGIESGSPATIPGMSWESGFTIGDGVAAGGSEHEQAIELFGLHLRLVGKVGLGRFGRLSDLINASSGYIRVHDVRLLRPDGEPTGAEFAEIMVDQDEISFIAQSEEQPPETLVATGFVEEMSTPGIEVRRAREFVMFTPAHTLSGHVYLFGQTHIDGFVDATDPRFVSVTEVTVRSLAEDRITGEYPFVLINRTQMIAASELEYGDDTSDADASDPDGSDVEAPADGPESPVPPWPEADFRPELRDQAVEGKKSD